MKYKLLALLMLVFSPGMVLAESSPIQQLGQLLYFDDSLSQPDGQACASCHAPSAAFVDPERMLPVSRGAMRGHFGGRNAPSVAYSMYTPPLHYDAEEAYWEGGHFWDGRAQGHDLGDSLAEQAMGPFLNPDEMGNPDKASVIREVQRSAYAELFEQVWGKGSLDDTDLAFEQVARSIAAFERSRAFAPFNSRYDQYLRACLETGADMQDCATGKGDKAAAVGKQKFSPREWRGLQLFAGANDNDGQLQSHEGAHCSECHSMQWSDADPQMHVPDWAPPGKVPPLFTDYSFHNIGVPLNPGYPLHAKPGDRGVGEVVNDNNHNGKFKAMTLRNIALTAPYAHNGFFRQLRDIVNFYNTRDVPEALPGRKPWPKDEHPETRNLDEMGNLGLSPADEDAIVAFLRSLSDQPHEYDLSLHQPPR